MTDHLAPPSAVGEIDICPLCDASPHAVGCPRHPDYDDERLSCASADDPEDAGCARYWVEETYAEAARDAGIGLDALRAADPVSIFGGVFGGSWGRLTPTQAT